MTRLLAPFDPATDPLSGPLRRYLATGDENAIETVVRATRPRLLAAARRIGSPDDAEDAVQSALLSLVRHRGGALDAPVFPWLLTATIRGAYRKKAVARRDRDLAERLATAPTSLRAPADAEDLARLRREVGRLPDRYRDPVVLHDLVGLSTAEVARLLDAPEATVRTRLARARRLVRSRWSPTLVAGVFTLPWFFVDRTRDAASGSAALAAGGLMSLKVAAPVLALGLALGAGIAYVARPSSSDEEKERARTADTEIASLRATVKRLEIEKEDAVHRNAAILAAASRPIAPPSVEAKAPEPKPVVKPVEPAVADGAGRFTIAGFEAASKGLDWAVIGKNMKEMPALTAAFAETYSKTETLDPDQVGRLQQLNGPLITAALKLGKALKRDNVNTAFTHPAFMANAIAAALEAAGMPLTEAQAKSIERLATDASAEEERRLRSYGDDAWALQKIVDDSEARERYFTAVFSQLTPEQSALLVPPATRGRMQVDIFSSALIWIGRSAPFPFVDRTGLVAAMERHTMTTLVIPEAKRPIVHDAVVEWGDGLREDVLEAAPDALSQEGFLPVGRILDAAKRTLALHHRILDTARLDEATAKRIRDSQFAFVPVHAAPPEPK